MLQLYFGKTPTGRKVHQGVELLSSGARGDYVKTFCNNEILSGDWQRGQLLPGGYRGEYCKICMRSNGMKAIEVLAAARAAGESFSDRTRALTLQRRREGWNLERYDAEVEALARQFAEEEEDLLTPIIPERIKKSGVIPAEVDDTSAGDRSQPVVDHQSRTA